jgi:hypothetical protein
MSALPDLTAVVQEDGREVSRAPAHEIPVSSMGSQELHCRLGCKCNRTDNRNAAPTESTQPTQGNDLGRRKPRTRGCLSGSVLEWPVAAHL